GRVRHGHPFHGRAQVLVRRHVDKTRLRAVSDRRPVLPSPVRGAELRGPAGTRLVCGIDVGPAGHRIEIAKYVLSHVWQALDEADRPGSPIEEPEVSVASDVDQSFHGPAIAL